MSVGDSVNGFSIASSYFSFQPAAGVVICLTSIGSHSTGAVLMTDGVNEAWFYNQLYSTQIGSGMNTKMFINNTNYLKIYGNSNSQWYSGIQVE